MCCNIVHLDHALGYTMQLLLAHVTSTFIALSQVIIVILHLPRQVLVIVSQCCDWIPLHALSTLMQFTQQLDFHLNYYYNI